MISVSIYFLYRLTGSLALKADAFHTGSDKKNIKQSMNIYLKLHQTDIQILSAHLQRTGPPEEVAGGFREVMNARVDKLRTINEAKPNAELRLQRAGTDAFETVSEAKAYAETRIKLAEGRSLSLEKKLLSPHAEDLPIRLAFDTLIEILPEVKKIIVPPDSRGRVTAIR